MLTNRLKEEREARHLTQEAVGNALSLDPNTIYRYETLSDAGAGASAVKILREIGQ